MLAVWYLPFCVTVAPSVKLNNTLPNVIVRDLQRNRTNRISYLFIPESLEGIGSLWLWRQSLSLSVAYKLETQERYWSISKVESWRDIGKSEDLRDRSAEGKRRPLTQLMQLGRKRIQPSSTSLFCWAPQWCGWCLPTWERVICFSQATNSDAHIFHKRSRRHPQKSCLASSL